VEGSKAKGRTMVNRGVRLTSRAFNNECDAAISNISWNNYEQIIKRVEKAFDSINKMNESSKIYISRQYLNLKLDELRLSHAYKEKKQEEREEQAEIKRQMREEVKLEKETESAKKEEEKYQKLLDKAHTEASKLSGDKLSALQEKIIILQSDLSEAHSKSERAISMAQQTRAGHVYIISNKGAFGDNVYKIGMTRRLEPLDRVRELGSASVPFTFDVHAMIYSDDAPSMESNLHKVFANKRVNLVSGRKEFFNVTLNEIKKEVMKFARMTRFTETAEAKEYYQSKAIRAELENKKIVMKSQLFPNEI